MKPQATPPAITRGNGNNSTIQKIDVLAEQLVQAGAIKYFCEQPEPRQWLIDHLIPKGQVVLLAGLGAEGKTMLCLQWAIQLALGINFSDNTKTNHIDNFKSLIVSAEDDRLEMHTRLRRISDYLISSGETTKNEIIYRQRDITIITDDTAPDWFSTLTETNKNEMRQAISYDILKHTVLHQNYNLVIIDALTSSFDADFKNISQMQRIMKLCKNLTKKGATVLIIHHMNKSAISAESFDDMVAGIFGSVGIPNRARHILILYKKILFVAKSNISKRVALRLENVDFFNTFEADEIIEHHKFDELFKSLKKGKSNINKKKGAI
jgi:RecA-family ATPase